MFKSNNEKGMQNLTGIKYESISQRGMTQWLKGVGQWWSQNSSLEGTRSSKISFANFMDLGFNHWLNILDILVGAKYSICVEIP